MTQRAKDIRFKTNPVELVIFFGITSLFSFSLYNLLYDKDQFELADLKVERTFAAHETTSEATSDRSPAAATPSFLPLTLDCGKAVEQTTRAPQARLTIPLCRTENGQLVKGGDVKLIQEAAVTNTANKVTATVFIDSNPLTTAPIALNSGKNPLHVEYTYRDGQKVTYDITITRE